MKALELKTIMRLSVYVSGSKAPLVRPVGLFGRGLSDNLALLLVLVDSETSASENVARDEAAGTPGFFTFFFLLALWENQRYQSVFIMSYLLSYKAV